MFAPGTRFGRYRIVEVLGRGGAGEVYRAHDPRLERDVAVKVLRPDASGEGAERRRRLIEEARAAAGVRHPSVVAIHDAGEADGVAFIVMELVPGRTLRARLLEGPIPASDGVAWSRALAAALAAAHDAGFVHRDVKPANVVVGDGGELTLLDFGIAKRVLAVEGASAAIETLDGHVRGTPMYMAPEALAGAAPSALADQFAWGLVAYEILAARAVREGAPGEAAVDLYADPPPLARVAPQLPPALSTIVARALSRRPSDRFADMGDLVAALDAVFVTDAGAADSRGESAPPRRLPRDEATVDDRPAARRDRGAEPRTAGRGRSSALVLALGAVVVALAAYATRQAAPPAAAHVTTAAPPWFARVASSFRPGATDAYALGLAALRESPSSTAFAAFQRAVDIDPLLAPAHLRMALLTAQHAPPIARAHYRSATQLRDRLDDRDRDLLDALEPLFASNAAEWRRRMTALCVARPRDPELLFYLSLSMLARGELDGAARTAQEVLDLDAGFLGAKAVRVEALAYLGDFSGALAAGDGCRSSGCLRIRMWILSTLGRCDELADEASRAVAADSHTFDTRELLADALASLNKPAAAAEALKEGLLWTSSPEDRDRFAARERSRFAALAGDFVTAEREARAWVTLTEQAPDLVTHGVAVDDLLDVLAETGDTRAAGEAADAFLARKDAWLLESVIEDDALKLDATPRALKASLRAHRRSQAAFDAERLAWATRMSDLGGPFLKPYVWVFGYAQVVDTKDEAEAALALLRETHVPPYRPRGRGSDRVGRTLFLSGRIDEALPELRAAASSCSAARDPYGSTRAHGLYAQALEAKGDRAEACAHYGVVLRRWAAAKPRSATGDHAAARSRALGCDGGG